MHQIERHSARFNESTEENQLKRVGESIGRLNNSQSDKALATRIQQISTGPIWQRRPEAVSPSFSSMEYESRLNGPDRLTLSGLTTPTSTASPPGTYESHHRYSRRTVPSSSARYAVKGSGGKGFATPLLGLSRNHETGSDKAACVAQSALKILQVSSQVSSTDDDTFDDTPSTRFDEVMDVREGSKVNYSYAFTDVKWGYGNTSNKLVTGCSNGCVILWDLASSTKPEQTKYEHDRAINRVVFGGAQGNWMMSAGQDGFCKLWDVRTPSVAHLALYTVSDPMRDLSFHPSRVPPHMYFVCTVSESGALTRWDLRSVTAPLDRVQAHTGGAMCVRWRRWDRLAVEDAGSWVATGGMDKTIKIWDMTASLNQKPVHTLYASRPLMRLTWRPQHPTHLAAIPVPSMSNTASASNYADAGTGAASDWTTEVEIWDVRREHLPRYVLKSGCGAVSSLAFPDGDRLWTTHKQSGMIVQHDLRVDTLSAADALPRSNLSWNSEGELAFTLASREDVVDDPSLARVEEPAMVMDQKLAALTSDAFGFDMATFRYLASTYVVDAPSFQELCEHNAQAAASVGSVEAAQSWTTLSLWLGTANSSEGAKPEPTKSKPVSKAEPITHGGVVAVRAPASRIAPARSSATSTIARSGTSDEMLSNVQMTSPSTAFSSHSSSEAEPPATVELLGSDSSDSRDRVETSSESTYRTASVVSANGNESSTLRTEGSQLHRALQMHNRIDDDSSSSSSESESESERRVRSPLVRPLIRGARVHSGSVDRTSSNARRVGAENLKMTQATGSGKVQKLLAEANVGDALDFVDTVPKVFPEDLLSHFSNLVQSSVSKTLQDCVDKGDVQLVVTVILAVRNLMTFGDPFVIRTVTAYLNLLRRQQLHVAAANVVKSCPLPQIFDQSQASTTIHTACGRCHKPLANPPYGYCNRCKQAALICCICHRRLYGQTLILCSVCGHGAHEGCVSGYLSSQFLSARSSSVTTPATSGPSTPGLLGQWFYGDEAWPGNSSAPSSVADDEPILHSCPSGCGHSPCALVPA